MREIDEIGPNFPAVNPGAPFPRRAEPSQDFSSVIYSKQEAGRGAKASGRAGAAPELLAAALARVSAGEEAALPAALSGSRDLPALVGLGPDADGRLREPADPAPVVPELALEVEGLLDPLARVFAGTTVPPVSSVDGVFRSVALPPDPALFRLLRRVAWGGNKRAGAVYLEFGSGELEGAGLTLTSAEGRVSVVLELPPGVGASDWEQRLQARLARRGLDVLSITVR